MPATIRDALPSDAAALCEAERDVVREHDGLLVSEPEELFEAAFRERIAIHIGGSAKVLIAECAGAIVGHASLWPMSLRKVSHVLRLDMCVHLGHWHQGHGRALLESLLAWARAHPGSSKVELLVRSENRSAVALYESAGFIHEGRIRNRIRLRDGRLIDDLSMGMLLHKSGDTGRGL